MRADAARAELDVAFDPIAPTVTPGQYKLRWITCCAFDAVRHFCGEGPPPGSVNDPTVCPYIERTFTVCP